MSKIPPLHPRKMCRILEKLGFEAIRQKGSHIFYRHPDGRGTVVPFHSGEDLGRGLVRSILRDIELPREEFLKFLRRR
ncbi:MAG: type II toxin-antitoxin system HicA family toxin [Chloroflexi bacterium]|nr:type II toxin-antitoxin system HicA family toxin [Chloroflexota bacterium]